MSVQLRSPNAIETRSTLRSGSGRRSASATRKPNCETSAFSTARSWPTPSIAALMSDRIAGPPPARSQPNATSPVPPARSSSDRCGRGASAWMNTRFQTRWMPSDIRSFIRSYFGATLSNTALTIGFLASSGTSRKPKSVVAPGEAPEKASGEAGRDLSLIGPFYSLSGLCRNSPKSRP